MILERPLVEGVGISGSSHQASTHHGKDRERETGETEIYRRLGLLGVCNSR
jgi:hypothetical protein